MRQRTWERISAWTAIALWCSWLLFSGIGVSMITSAPAPSSPPAAIATQQSAKPPRHATKAAAAAPAIKPAPSDEEILAQVFGIFALLAFVLAIAATKWWTWRRKQRIRAEIRVEAWRGPASANPSGKSRAAGV